MYDQFIPVYAAGGEMDPAMQGGAPAPQGAPQPGAPAPQGPEAGGEGGDPTAQLQQMLGQYAQTRDPQLAVQICDGLVQMSGAGQGAPEQGGAPQDPGMGGAPAGPEGQQPMARNGMRLPQRFAKGGKTPMSPAVNKFQQRKGGHKPSCSCGAHK